MATRTHCSITRLSAIRSSFLGRTSFQAPLLMTGVVLSAFALTGCFGGGSRPAAQPAVTQPAAVSAGSAIPGLSAADLRAMPPAPMLPQKLDHTATPEAIQDLAERTAKSEASKGQLGTISAEKRALFLAHMWGQEVFTMQRGQPSEIPGLTIGEIDMQPPVPTLPDLYDLIHTHDDLQPHALIVALEEFDAGYLPADLSTDARTIYLVWAWTPLFEERQARYQAAVDQRDAASAYRLEEAKRKGDWDRQHKTLRQETQIQLDASRTETIPILTPEQERELSRMGG